MNISVFCASSHPNDYAHTAAARELGSNLAKGGHTLLYGGSNLGLMGEVSGAALSEGGRVVAVIPTFFSEEIINSQPVSQIVRVCSMAERKEYLIAHSDAFVALPGGIGTLDEVSEVMVYNQLGPLSNAAHRDKPVLLLNIGGFYDPLLAQLQAMRDAGFLRTSGGRVAPTTVGELMRELKSCLELP